MQTKPNAGRFVVGIESENLGGNIQGDIIELTSGAIVVITEECCCLYAGRRAWEEGESGDMLETGRDEGFELDQRGVWNFVRDVETYEPRGPVTVDLLTLHDGRVIGIDPESLVLYRSRDAFEGATGAGHVGALDLPASRNAPGSVGAAVSEFWRDALDGEVASIPADSVVGGLVVKACAATDALLACAGEDGGFEESRDVIRGAVLRQTNVWYFG